LAKAKAGSTRNATKGCKSFLRKQFDIAGSIWLAVRCGIGTLPEEAAWRQVYGLALLTGIGFTMSLFTGTLADPAEGYDIDVRVPVLLASLISAVCGYVLLRGAARACQPKSTVTTS
jgi:Na+:H+ antiporter, NhaA family